MKITIEKQDILFFMLIVLGLIFCLMPFLYLPEESYTRYSNYEYYADSFSKDPIILDISNKCRNSVNPVKCIFDLVPMDYDFGRVEYSESDFRKPEDYFIFGGVCRDFVILRASALDNLGIYCMFDFSEEHHVFLVCMYEGKVYTLNNGLFY